MRRVLVCVLCASIGFAAAAATETADFSGSELPFGWTFAHGEYCSPEYSNAVDRIELRYAGTEANASATVSAASVGGGTVQNVATLTAASSGASFDFPETTDFRSFRIAVDVGWSLASFSAVVSAGALDTPADVTISNNVTGTSFDAYWTAVEGATGYRVYVWTNAVGGVSAGTEVWSETFPNSPEKPSGTTNFKDEWADHTGWTCEKVAASATPGAVRVGQSSAKGVLVSPPLPSFSESPLTLRITAWRQTTSEGTDTPLGIVSGGETNIFGYVKLGDESATYHVAIPALNEGESIAIFSPTNKSSARVIVDDVAIVSGYSEGSLAPSYIVDGLDVGAATSYSFADLPSVPVSFAVEAYGRRGVSSTKTEAAEIDLANPDKIAVLNACPLSSLASSAYTYSQNFDSLAAITATTGDKEWLNGTTLPYWQAYDYASAVTSFKYNGGSINTGGLYALATNQNGFVRSLGARSSSTSEFSWGISFTNDTDRTMTLATVAYAAQQWGFGNNTNQTLSVSAKVADGLDWISAYADGWTELGSSQSRVYGSEDPHDTPVSAPVSLNPAISIAPGQVVSLKWTAQSLKKGTLSMMGIDDVTVMFAVQRSSKALVIRLADNAD